MPTKKKDEKVYCRDCIFRRLVSQTDTCHFDKKKPIKCRNKNRLNNCGHHETSEG